MTTAVRRRRSAPSDHGPGLDARIAEAILGIDTLWAANATVDNAVRRKHGTGLARQVIWNGFIPTATGGTAAKTWDLLRPQLEERLRERERAVREGREPPELPALVTAETSTATFQARAYWTGGFFRANGTEKPATFPGHNPGPGRGAATGCGLTQFRECSGHREGSFVGK